MECNSLCTLLMVILVINISYGTLSKQDRGKKKDKKKTVKIELSEKNVWHKGLVSESISTNNIIEQHMSYGVLEKSVKNFTGTTLAYVTPWNNHGYDIAKIFTNKFNMISTVWLQVKRKMSGSFVIEGGHDIDTGWMQEVKENGKVEIVPRILFDGWSANDYKQLFASEEMMLHCSETIVQFIKTKKFSGAVIEIWSQLGGQMKDDLIHFIVHLGEHFQKNQKTLVLVLPPPSIDKNRQGIVTKADFDMILPFVDYVSLMTYDFSNPTRAGPTSPLQWMKQCVETLSPESSNHRHKILLGLNFYGYQYSSGSSSPIIGTQFVDLLSKHRMKVQVDRASDEHVFSYRSSGVDHVIYFPTLHSIHLRLQLARQLDVGIAIWEIGQGLDYFYDLL